MKDHKELEQCDKQFTQALTTANNKCIIPNDAPWGEEVNNTFQIWKYWRIAMNRRHKQKCKMSQMQEKITKQFTNEQITQGKKSCSTRGQFKYAMNNLIKQRQIADTKRTDRFKNCIANAALTNETETQNALLAM